MRASHSLKPVNLLRSWFRELFVLLFWNRQLGEHSAKNAKFWQQIGTNNAFAGIAGLEVGLMRFEPAGDGLGKDFVSVFSRRVQVFRRSTPSPRLVPSTFPTTVSRAAWPAARRVAFLLIPADIGRTKNVPHEQEVTK
jgi:hypothetical protein